MLSQRGRYALKAMINLTRAAPASKQVSAIAAEEQIPRKFLEAIMTDLRRAGLVDSRVGKTGGYTLARDPAAITFGEVVRLTDGPLALIPCASQSAYAPCADCPDEVACALRRVMIEVRAQMSDVLDHVSLSEAAGGPPLSL